MYLLLYFVVDIHLFKTILIVFSLSVSLSLKGGKKKKQYIKIWYTIFSLPSPKKHIMSPAASAPAPPKSHSIASVPADGIGPEVIDAAIAVLNTLATTLGTFDINFTHFDWSSETYKKTGKYIPDGGLEELKKHDAILFGAVGAPGTIIPRSRGIRHCHARM